MTDRTTTLHFPINHRMADAAMGDGDAAYDLGICYQTGTAGVAIDLIEAHKWFNLAAVAGMAAAQDARAEVAAAMSARQIATAQAAARAWMGSMQRAV
jgi:TPR repeat protein